MSITEILVKPQTVAWLPWAVQYFFYIGSAYAAAILLLVSLMFKHNTSHTLRSSFALVLAISAIVGPLALTADLHQPGRALHFFTHLTSWSWMSRGAILLPLFSMLAVATAWLYLRPDLAKLQQQSNKVLQLLSYLTLGKWSISDKQLLCISALTALSGLSIALYTGFEVAVIHARPLWNQPASPFIWFITAFMGAIGLSLLMMAFLPSDIKNKKNITQTDRNIIKRTLFLTSLLALILLPIWASNAASSSLLHHTEMLWDLAGVEALFLTILLLSILKMPTWRDQSFIDHRIQWLLLSILTLLSCWCVRWVTMIDTQTLPKFDVGPYPYHVDFTSAGLLGIAAMAGLWLALASAGSEIVSLNQTLDSTHKSSKQRNSIRNKNSQTTY